MAVLIGSARIDERGKATGGQAGDQNGGKEVSTQAWYQHSKGWRVFRCTDVLKAVRIATAMKRACENDHIGYDQYGRLTLYNAAKNVGFDPGTVTTDVETDCSALVRVCLAYAGITVGNFTTPNEAAMLMNSGLFMEMKGAQYTKSSDYLRAGDVLVTATKGHTVVVLTDGAKAAEASAEPDASGGGYRTVTSRGNWSIRQSAGVLSRRICIVPSGTCLRVYGSRGGWYAVKAADGKGWISGKAFAG